MAPTADQNVVSLFARATERMPDRPALIFQNGGASSTITFSQLMTRAARLASGLAAAGLGRGDRAVVMIPMSAELYVSLLAILQLGAVAVFVDPWISHKRIAAFAAFSEPRAFLGIPKSHLLRWMDKRLRSIPLTATTGRRLWRWPTRHTLDELEASAPDHHITPVSNEDPALITFTSGSSGTPKGANRTHGFLAAQHRALDRQFRYSDADVDMPMFPVFALNNLARGIVSIVPQMDFKRVDQVDGAVILDQMATHGVTTCTASPPFFDRLAEEVRRTPTSRPALRRILTGGAPVTDAQLRFWRSTFRETEVLVVYGSTEAEPVAHIEASERLALSEGGGARPGYCVGTPVDGLRTRLVRISRGALHVDDGWSPLDVARDAVGELLVAGDHVCGGYFKNSAAERENKVIDGDTTWHRMGDTGSFDDAGRIWLVGRVHSTIFRGGRAIHAQQIEQVAIGDDTRIHRAAAVGLPDTSLGERLVLVLEATNEPGLEEAIAERLRAAGHLCDEIRITSDSFPLDPRHNSKIDYHRLRAQLTRQPGVRP